MSTLEFEDLNNKKMQKKVNKTKNRKKKKKPTTNEVGDGISRGRDEPVRGELVFVRYVNAWEKPTSAPYYSMIKV